jgi:pyruvate dehydrogenase E2 component (dihydrolipoamide acetyltransferase)
MAVLVDMPKLGMNMTKGTIVKWLVQEGDQVRAGQPLFEVETDKVVQEVEANASGVLARIITPEDKEVPCTKVIAVITEPGEPVPDDIPEMMPGADQPHMEVEVRVRKEEEREGAVEEPAVAPRKRIPITPLARKVARELGVDTSKIVPSGKRIVKAEVEAAHQAQLAAAEPTAPAVAAPVPAPSVSVPAPDWAEPLQWTKVRQTTAERMAHSARTTARVGLTLEADATELIGWREQLKSNGNQIGYNELLAKIVAQALAQFPYMNAQQVEGSPRVVSEVNIGIATDTERGLLVPVVRNANQKGVLQIGREFAAMVERARGGKSTLDDLSGGTFTITNLGMYEIEEFLPIINLPECAILGVGAIVKKPVVLDDTVVIRRRLTITLAFDHRLVDGAPAARFLQRVKQMIESPLEMLS